MYLCTGLLFCVGGCGLRLGACFGLLFMVIGGDLFLRVVLVPFDLVCCRSCLVCVLFGGGCCLEIRF